MIQVECVRDAHRLEALRVDWDRLSRGSVMQRFSWLMSWWRAYQANHRLHVLVAYRGEQVCGLMPLAETKTVWTGCTLVFMGSGKVCSDNQGILSDASDVNDVSDAFAMWLSVSPDCCRWDHLDLDGVREHNSGMKRFGETLAQETGTRIDFTSSPNCWAASLEGGLDAYKSRLTKRVRKILRESEIEYSSGRSGFEIAQTLDQARAFVREIEQMHQQRWKERGIDGCFSQQSFSNFLDHALHDLWQDPWSPVDGSHVGSESESQRVHIAMLRIDGKAAAGTICIRDRDSLDVYLTGMNPEFEERRPGWQLNERCIRFAIDTGCKKFDFLRGDEAYKERLGGLPSVQHRWLVPSPRWTSQLRNRAYRTAIDVKGWWQSKPTKTLQKSSEMA